MFLMCFDTMHLSMQVLTNEVLFFTRSSDVDCEELDGGVSRLKKKIQKQQWQRWEKEMNNGTSDKV